jgi:hypothetical protein
MQWKGYHISGTRFRARIKLPGPKGERALRPDLGTYDTEAEAAR